MKHYKDFLSIFCVLFLSAYLLYHIIIKKLDKDLIMKHKVENIIKLVSNEK